MFRRKKEKKRDEDEEAERGRIREILASERVLKQEEYEGGTICLTENHLLWESKTEKSKSAVVPRESILEAKQAVKFRKGMGIEVNCGDRGKHFFPFMTRMWVKPTEKAAYHTDFFDAANSWVATLETGVPSTVFVNVLLQGSHAHKGAFGKVTITPTTLAFQPGKGVFEIPLEKIENVFMMRGRKVPKWLWAAAPGLAFLANDPKMYLFVQHGDESGVKQASVFDFASPHYEDKRDRRKTKAIQLVKGYQEKMRRGEVP